LKIRNNLLIELDINGSNFLQSLLNTNNSDILDFIFQEEILISNEFNFREKNILNYALNEEKSIKFKGKFTKIIANRMKTLLILSQKWTQAANVLSIMLLHSRK